MTGNYLGSCDCMKGRLIDIVTWFQVSNRGVRNNFEVTDIKDSFSDIKNLKRKETKDTLNEGNNLKSKDVEWMLLAVPKTSGRTGSHRDVSVPA